MLPVASCSKMACALTKLHKYAASRISTCACLQNRRIRRIAAFRSLSNFCMDTKPGLSPDQPQLLPQNLSRNTRTDPSTKSARLRYICMPTEIVVGPDEY